MTAPEYERSSAMAALVQTSIATAVTGTLTVELLPATAVTAIAPRWQALAAKVNGDGLTRSWDWVETWLNHYGDLVPHLFAVGESEGEIRGLALVTQGVKQRRGPIPVRTVHVGTAGAPAQDTVYVEYNRLLVMPQERSDFARGLLAAIQNLPWRWEELTLDGFVPEDATPFLDSDPNFFVRREVCPTTDLAAIRAGGGDVIAALGKSTRYNIRRSLRGFGPVEMEWAATPEHATDILNELIDLHQRRWRAAGKPGVFASGRFTAFHRELIPRLLKRDAVILYRVRGERGTIGCLYSFIEYGRVLFYQSGFADVEDERLKPGLVTHALCMQACLERGLIEYDYLQGDARYKRELSTVERELIWAVAARPSLKQHLLAYARRRKFGDGQVGSVG